MVKSEVHQNHFSWLGIQPFFEILSIAAKCMEVTTIIFLSSHCLLAVVLKLLS